MCRIIIPVRDHYQRYKEHQLFTCVSSLVAASHHSHKTKLHPRQLWGIMFNDSLDFCASLVIEWFHSVLHFPEFTPVQVIQAANLGGRPRPSSPQLPPPAPPGEWHGVPGPCGRYNPSSVRWVISLEIRHRDILVPKPPQLLPLDVEEQ